MPRRSKKPAARVFPSRSEFLASSRGDGYVPEGFEKRDTFIVDLTPQGVTMRSNIPSTHTAVVARLDRAIQDSRDADDKSRSRGVPDHPLSRVMTTEPGVAAHVTF